MLNKIITMKLSTSLWIFMAVVTIGTAHVINGTEIYCLDSVFNSTLPPYAAKANSILHQTRAIFSCPQGKTRIGQRYIGCFKDGRLRKPRPVCVPIACEFASATCGWSTEESWETVNGTIRPKEEPTDTTQGCANFTLRSPMFPRDSENQRSFCFSFLHGINKPRGDQDFAELAVFVEEQANRTHGMIGRTQLYLRRYCNITRDKPLWVQETIPIWSLMNQTDGYQIVIEGSGNISLGTFEIEFCTGNETLPSTTSLDTSCGAVCYQKLKDDGKENTTGTTDLLDGAIISDAIEKWPELGIDTNGTSDNNSTIVGKAGFELFDIPLHVWIGAGALILLIIVVNCLVCARVFRYRNKKEKQTDDACYDIGTNELYTESVIVAT